MVNIRDLLYDTVCTNCSCSKLKQKQSQFCGNNDINILWASKWEEEKISNNYNSANWQKYKWNIWQFVGLTHRGIVTPYSNIDLGRCWLM